MPRNNQSDQRRSDESTDSHSAAAPCTLYMHDSGFRRELVSQQGAQEKEKEKEKEKKEASTYIRG